MQEKCIVSDIMLYLFNLFRVIGCYPSMLSAERKKRDRHRGHRLSAPPELHVCVSEQKPMKR